MDEAHASQPSLASDEVLGAILQTAITLTGAERGYLILRAGEDLEVRLGRVAGSGELSPTMSIP
ncbi:MAG TPA: hypothetical protein VH302_12620 [Bryobacteraceae bacterium]|nr:hypothetical protein [Bryobacteraceae bacterium]